MYCDVITHSRVLHVHLEHVNRYSVKARRLLSLRLSDSLSPAEHMLMKNTSHVGVGITQSNAPTLNDALALYLRLKSEGKSDTFYVEQREI